MRAGSRELGATSFDALSLDQQAILKARLIREMRTNTYEPETRTLTISPERAAVFDQLAAYYGGIFQNGKPEYAIPRGALLDTHKQRQMAAFFWWTAWATTTNRPASDITIYQ